MEMITDFINEYGLATFIIAILMISILIGQMRIHCRLSRANYWPETMIRLETMLNDNDSRLVEIQISVDRLHNKVDKLLRDRD